ncbi:Sodium channel protein Nach [Gryllus bimaculatus]|nr:Sodium channel protein Nach [Gryllus bimaculatus]
MHPSKDMQDYSSFSTPARRKCLFPGERRLQFFQYYTQSNCELECLANTTFRECKCVDFYMPQNRSMPVCKQDQESCVKKVIERINWGRSSEECGPTDPPCGCIQTCTYLHYKVETSSGNLHQKNENISHERSNIEKESPISRSVISIYFEDSHYLPLERKPLRDTLDILANVGGFMGLCLGMSLLSVIELFYWILIRPCCQRIKQSNPQLRSIKKAIAKKVEASVQYSRQFENEENRV